MAKLSLLNDLFYVNFFAIICPLQSIQIPEGVTWTFMSQLRMSESKTYSTTSPITELMTLIFASSLIKTLMSGYWINLNHLLKQKL